MVSFYPNEDFQRFIVQKLAGEGSMLDGEPCAQLHYLDEHDAAHTERVSPRAINQLVGRKWIQRNESDDGWDITPSCRSAIA